jgi:small-conductance mechanosensitive channel|tara:strand:+ start:145 stop:375 length:231 start_codon:yes stop_codon:yes gene_type:complete
MADDKQKQIDDLYAKYQKTLELLNDALDQLAKKPKEVEVEKIVEVEADIDLATPDAIAELERKVEQKVAANAESEE